MATLNWKTPNGTTGSLILENVVTSVATGTSNGTIAINGTDVSVKGLGSAAYTASTAYATSSHTHSYLPLSGGTLTGNLNISKTDPTIQLDKNNITRGTAPSAAVNKVDIVARDSADKSVWGIYSRYGTDKSLRTDLICYKGTTNDTVWTGIGVGYDASGNAFTYAPTPASNDNSTKIATTAFCNTNYLNKTDLKSKFIISTITKQVTINSDDSKSYDDTYVDTTKSGYTSLGLVGWKIDGTNSTYCLVTRAYFNGTNSSVYLTIRNPSSKNITLTISYQILYVSNS